MTDPRERVALHESGHGVVAHALRRRVDFLSTRAGDHYSGIATYVPPRVSPNGNGKLHVPAILLDARLRRAIETRICVALAGSIAEEMAGPLTGSHVQDERSAMAAAAGLAALSHRQVKTLERLERSDPFPTDDESAKDLAWIIAGDQSVALVGFLRETTRAIVHSRRRSIQSVAEVLLQREVLTGPRASGNPDQEGGHEWPVGRQRPMSCRWSTHSWGR